MLTMKGKGTNGEVERGQWWQIKQAFVRRNDGERVKKVGV